MMYLPPPQWQPATDTALRDITALIDTGTLKKGEVAAAARSM